MGFPITINKTTIYGGEYWPDSIWRGYVDAGVAYSGAEFIVLGCGEICGVVFDRGTRWERRFMQGDSVEIHSDSYGYIAPGITKPGHGKIAGIVNDGSDHLFHVITDQGEDGNVKLARLI